MTSLHPTPPGCPYASAWSVLELARAEGSTVEWVASEQAFRIGAGASQELRQRVRELSGAHSLDLTEPGALARWGALAEELGELSPVRLVRGKDGVGKLVFIRDPRRQALERMCRTTGARELLTLSPTVLRELSVPWTLVLERKPEEAQRRAWGAIACKFVVTTARTVYEQAQRDRVPVFVARELEAAALAAEVNRAHACQLDSWLNAKKRGEWRLTHSLTGALDVNGVDETQRVTWSLGRVLDALDVEMVSGEVHEVKGAQ